MEHFRHISKQLFTGNYESLHVGKQPMGMCRFSINSILWFGKDMKTIDGIVPGDDEEFLSSIYSTQHGRANCWNCDAIMAHFAFFTQREQLDKAHILEQNGSFLLHHWKGKTLEVSNAVQKVMHYCEEHAAELMAQPSPYRHPEIVKLSAKSKLTNKINKSVPWYLQPAWNKLRQL